MMGDALLGRKEKGIEKDQGVNPLDKETPSASLITLVAREIFEDRTEMGEKGKKAS